MDFFHLHSLGRFTVAVTVIITTTPTTISETNNTAVTVIRGIDVCVSIFPLPCRRRERTPVFNRSRPIKMVVQWFVPRFPDADGFKACVDTATKIKQAVPTQIDVDAQPASDFTAESANWAEVAVATINRCLQGGFNRPMSMSPREMALIDVDGNSPLGQNYKTRSKNAEKLDREMEKAREEAKAQVALGEAVGDEEDDGGDDQPTQTGEQSAAEASSAADEVAAAKKARKFKTPYDETLCAADFGARRLPKGVYVVLQEGPPSMLTGVRPPQIAWSIRQDAEGRLASQWNVPPAFPDADAVFSAFSNRLASLGHRLAVQKSKSYDKYIFTKALFDQARDDVLQFATSRDVVNTLRLRRVPSRLRERRVQGRHSLFASIEAI